jgi:hypothetical protein
MKLDPKTAERMKRAAIERQAQKQAEAAKQPSKRDPGYDAVTRRKLKKAGLDARSEQPQSVLEALANIPDAQTERITAMRYQDATGDKHKSGRAAMVQQVSDVLHFLTLEAQTGWLGYADLWESAQPKQTAAYGEKLGGSIDGKDKDPAWLIKAGELRRFNKTLDKRVARWADEFMRTRETMAVNAITLSILEKSGLHIARAFKDWN